MGHTGAIYALEMAENKAYTSGADGMIVEWDYLNHQNGVVLAQIPEAVYSLLWYNGILYAGTSEGNVYGFTLNGQKNFYKIVLLNKGVFDIKEIQDKLWIAGGDGKIHVLNTLLNEIEDIYSISSKRLRRIEVLESKNEIISGGTAGILFHISLEGAIKKQIQVLPSGVLSLAWANSMIWCGGRDALLKSFDYQGNLVHEIKAHTLHIHDLNFNTTNKFLASSSMDKRIRFWNPESGSIIRSIGPDDLNMHKSSINRIKWVNETMLISISDDKTMKIWQVLE